MWQSLAVTLYLGLKGGNLGLNQTQWTDKLILAKFSLLTFSLVGWHEGFLHSYELPKFMLNWYRISRKNTNKSAPSANSECCKSTLDPIMDLPSAGRSQTAVSFPRRPHRRASLPAWPGGTPSVTSGYDQRSPHLCSHWGEKKNLNKTPMNTHIWHQVHTQDKLIMFDFPDLHSSHRPISALFLLSYIDKAANCELDPRF